MPRNCTFPRWTILVAGVLLATGLAATQLPARSEAKPVPIPRPIRPPVLSAPAILEPTSQVVELQAEMQGRLAVMAKASGDPIRRGELLAELANEVEKANVSLRQAELARSEAVLARLEAGARSERKAAIEAELRRAEAALEGARVDLGRMETLAARGVQPAHALDGASATFEVRRAERDAAKARRSELLAGERPEVLAESRAEVARARAALELAEAQLGRTRIVSPFDGICVYRFKEPGEVVGRQSDQVPVMTIASDGPLRLRADVDAADVSRVRVGQLVRASAPAFQDQVFQGVVVKLESTLGRKNFRTDRPREKVDTKVLEVLIELDPGTELPLGLEMTCVFLGDTHAAARHEISVNPLK